MQTRRRASLQHPDDVDVEHDNKRIRRSNTAKEDQTSLPSEILEIIFDLCEPCDLYTIICASKGFYQVALPSLYRFFKPEHWTEIVELKRLLKKGLASVDMDRVILVGSIVSRIHTIDLSQLSETLLDAYEDTCTIDWVSKKTLRCLVYVVERTRNIRVFKANAFLYHTASRNLWDALAQHHHLQELNLPKFQYFDEACGQDSEIGNLTGIRTLELGCDNLISETGMSRCVENLLNSSVSSIQVLTLQFGQYKHESRYPTLPLVDEEHQFPFFKIEEFSNLRKLTLYGLQNKAREIVAIISLLPRLEKFSSYGVPKRWPGENEMNMIIYTHLEEGLIPLQNARKVVETDDKDLLIHLLTSKVAELVHIGWDLFGQASFNRLRGALYGCQSLREVHLISGARIGNGWSRSDERKNLVSLIRSLPRNTRRLAIRSHEHNSNGGLTLHNSDEKSDLMKALGHLDNLEQLILPFACRVEEVARSVSDSHLLTSLKWVYFRSIYEMAKEQGVRDRGLHGKDVTPYWWRVPEEEAGAPNPFIEIDGIKITTLPPDEYDTFWKSRGNSLIKDNGDTPARVQAVKLYMPLCNKRP